MERVRDREMKTKKKKTYKYCILRFVFHPPPPACRMSGGLWFHIESVVMFVHN